jgi:hypothetical protein
VGLNKKIKKNGKAQNVFKIKKGSSLNFIDEEKNTFFKKTHFLT